MGRASTDRIPFKLLEHGAGQASQGAKVKKSVGGCLGKLPVFSPRV